MKWSSLTTINGRIVCLCRVEINFGRIDSWCQCYKCIYSRLIVLNVERFTTNKKSYYKTFENIFLFNILCLKLIAAWLILRDGGEVWNQSVILSWIQKHIIHLTSTATSSLLDGPLDSHFKEKMTFFATVEQCRWDPVLEQDSFYNLFALSLVPILWCRNN